MKTYRIPFSRISTAWLRRSLMVLAYLPMVACNWLFILWAAAKSLLLLPLVVLLKALVAPFELLGEDFLEAWHGRGPVEFAQQDSAQAACTHTYTYLAPDRVQCCASCGAKVAGKEGA